jgi:hydrogenase-4 component F
LLPRTVLVAFGAFSLFVAALFIVRQQGIKRLMAYSSVEHMGVLALGFGFGGPLAIAAVLYHMLNHSLGKSLMFFGAGNVMRVFGTTQMDEIRGVWDRFPVSGALWLAGAVAMTGAPPFGLFLSELTLMRAGMASANVWAVIVMLLLLIVIWMTLPMWLALVPVLVLGLWWPQDLWRFFETVAADLGGAVR